MPRLTIDGHPIEVPPQATVLAAARQLGIDIPALCFREGCQPATSCLACVVRVRGRNGLVPSCATLAEEGMEVQSETPEVHQARRTALELLLSDHVGDCLAPCQLACPAHLDIPRMLRQIAGGRLSEAIVTIKQAIALPAVLARICPRPCEKACRRSAADGPVSICQLKRVVAEWDLAAESPYLPDCKPPSGKRVAIVGAGPTGLSAAWQLRCLGHAVTILEEGPEPGGQLRQTSPRQLPRDLLTAEIGLVLRLGAVLEPNTGVGRELSLQELCRRFDAVLLACGTVPKQQVERWGLKPTAQGILVDRSTFQSSLPGVFAAGSAIRGKGLAVRSVADGREVAEAVDQYLAGGPVRPRQKPFSTRIGKLRPEELARLVCQASPAPPRQPEGPSPFSLPEAIQQAERCLHCDCRARSSCKLRRYAAAYGAEPARFRGQRRPLEQLTQPSGLIYEPGKCIDCGLCVQIAAAAREPLGLTFVGRGFDVRIGVPFDRPLEEALGKVAAECVAACPTAALAWKQQEKIAE